MDHRISLNLSTFLQKSTPPNFTLCFSQRLTNRRFILKSGAQGGGPFLNSSEAHLHISFSCVAYLNTAYSLLPKHSTRGQQAAVVATGLHGLLPYANRYWSDHLLTYCSSASKPIPRSLVAQLIALVGYQKPPAVAVGPQAAEITNADDVQGLHALDQLPKVQSLILSARSSRNKAEATNELDDFEKSIEGRHSWRFLFRSFMNLTTFRHFTSRLRLGFNILQHTRSQLPNHSGVSSRPKLLASVPCDRSSNPSAFFGYLWAWGIYLPLSSMCKGS